MYKQQQQALMGDAWIREAQEASVLVEDIESRVNNNNNPTSLKHHENYKLAVADITTHSKLFEAGIKLDRLESLLRNPPSKPILTKEDLDYRWKMLSDMQLRTRSLALSLYALPNSSRPGCLTPGNTDATNIIVNDYEQDQTKTSLSNDEPELFRPLIPNDKTSQSQAQMKQCGSSTSLSLLKKVLWIFGAVVGSAALLFILVIICAVI